MYYTIYYCLLGDGIASLYSLKIDQSLHLNLHLKEWRPECVGHKNAQNCLVLNVPFFADFAVRAFLKNYFSKKEETALFIICFDRWTLRQCSIYV